MDTVANLVGQTKAMRKELQTLLSENQTQKEENDRLRSRESDVDLRIRNALEGERDQLRSDREQFAQEKQATSSLLDELKQKFDNRNLLPRKADLPIGLGLQPGDGDTLQGSADDLIWIDPQDATAIDAQGKPLPSGSNKPASVFNFPNTFADQINMDQRELKANSGAVDVISKPTAINPRRARCTPCRRTRR
jgi:integrating conjugative element protein (TIGR03752 family)